MVGTDTTGHAEAVAVTYDPRQVSYGRLGRRSFPANAEQAAAAKAYIAQLDQARIFRRAIVTTIEMDREFYPAEAYHQDFLVKSPTYRYIVVNDLPKIDNLKRLFADRFRVAPVLVSSRE